MRLFPSLLGAIVALSMPLSAMAFSLDDYEVSTQVAHRYVAGELDQRLIEIGSNAETKVFNVNVGRTHKDGVERYCRFYARFGIDAPTLKGTCDRTIKVTGSGGVVTSF